MAAITPNQQVRYAEGDDAPDLTVISRNLAEDLERLGVMRFTSATDRDHRLPSPLNGMIIALPGGHQRFLNNRWDYFPPRPVFTEQQSDRNGSSFSPLATWTDFADSQWGAAGIVVPASGQVRVILSASLRNVNTTTSVLRAGFRVSGARTIGFLDDDCLAVEGGRLGAGITRLVGNMTPGQTMTVTPGWAASSAGTADQTYIRNGQLFLDPVA